MTELEEIKSMITALNEKFSVAPRWLSLKRACLYASMSENKLLEHIEHSNIYGTKKGGKWYVDKESIDNFMLSDKYEVEKRFEEISRRAV